jgi:hypothetical protein
LLLALTYALAGLRFPLANRRNPLAKLQKSEKFAPAPRPGRGLIRDLRDTPQGLVGLEAPDAPPDLSIPSEYVKVAHDYKLARPGKFM